MRKVETSEDYIHPSLSLLPTTTPRTYWRPGAKDNTLNAWRHRCDLVASRPTNDKLRGRSIAIKDNVSIGGLPTTAGTFTELLCKDGNLPVSPIDASVVSRVLAAGAVLKGSSNCENYCIMPLSFTSATGPVHNPWMHGYTTGGSSSGSGALVAARLAERETGKSLGETVDMAIGGDQGGSIRIPASYNGIYGLKPTHGLVPYTGAVPLAPMIDHLGPMAANLEDIASLLQVLAGWDGLDPRMTPESPLPGQVQDYPGILAEFRNRKSAAEGSLDKPLRIGILTESFNLPGVSQEVRDTVRESARSAFTAAGAAVRDVSVPIHLDAFQIWTAATRPSSCEWACQAKTSGFLSFLPPHIRAQWPPDQTMYELLTATNPAVMNVIFSHSALAKHYGSDLEAKAHRKIFELRAAYDRAFADVDILVTPCAPTVAIRHPKMQADAEGPRSTVMEKMGPVGPVTQNTAPFNATGHPAMSAPCGIGSAEGQPDVKLPIGMQLVGRRWEDATVLKAAVVLEEGRAMAS